MIRQTSLHAHDEIQGDGSALSQRATIRDFLMRFSEGLTRNEVSRMLGIPINAVTGRVRELIKSGLVEEIGKRRDTYSEKENYVLKAII